MNKHLLSQFPPMPPGALQGHAPLTLVGDLVLAIMAIIALVFLFTICQFVWDAGVAITRVLRRVWQHHLSKEPNDHE